MTITRFSGRRRAAAALAVAVSLAAPVIPVAVAQTPNPVVDWHAHAGTILITPTNGTGALVLHAIVQAAVYDAVNAIDGGYEPYLSSPSADGTESEAAAAIAAAYRVLLALAPAQQATLDGLYASSIAALPAGSATTRGIAIGEAAAAAILAARASDGRFGMFRFSNPAAPAPGVWRPVLPAFANDPNAWVARMTPFLVRSSAQFRSKGPNALTSRKYAREFDEVKAVGGAISATRTADQTDQARFWGDNPFALFGRITRGLATDHHLDTADAARFFAMTYLTAADAQITVWDDKARWSFWRPITAIREATTDGNARTAADPSWLPLIPTPPYPDHPSGLSAVGAAFALTYRDFFGTDKDTFSASSNFSGTTRTYTRYSQLYREIVDARVFGGIHFRTPDVQGARIGKDVAKWREHHYFAPVKHRG